MVKKFSKWNFEIVAKAPKLIIVVALVLTIIAGVLAAGLSLELNWVALAPKGNESVKEYQQIIEDFPTLSNVVVLVEGEDINLMKQVVEDLNIELSTLDEYVVSVTTGIDPEFALDYGLLLASEEEVLEMAYMLADPNFESLYSIIGILLEESSKSLEYKTPVELNTERHTIKSINELLVVMNEYKKGLGDKEKLEKVLKGFMTGSTLITSEDGKMTMVMVQPSFDIMDMTMLQDGVNSIEAVIKSINEKYPEIQVRGTGMHIVARDEMASIESDSSLTTLLAVAAILGILYFAFKSFSAPLLAFVPLILGIIWDVGLTMLLIGRLNMMTVFAAAMLIGLGIDYSIHMYSSYTERRSKGSNKLDALDHAMGISGPGILTGGLTTAAAFLALNISSLELLKELGTVMGFGIICTLLSVFWVLPAIIVLKKENESKMLKISGDYKWIGNLAVVIKKSQVIVLIILVISTVFMSYKAKDIEFDLNLMNLEPENLESIELMTYMVEKYDMSADAFSVELDSLEEVYRLHEEFSKIDNVKEVTSIASFIPKEDIQEKKLENIKQIKEMLSEKAPLKELEIETLLLITDYNQESLEKYTKVYKKLYGETEDLDILKKSLEELTKDLKESENLKTLGKDYYDIAFGLFDRMLSVEKLKVENLPDNFKKQFVSEDGEKYLLSIYPEFDIWSNMGTEKGEKFFRDIVSVDKSITGTPIFMKVLYESVSDELLLVGAVLVSILFLILLIHFKSIKYAILAFLPLPLTLVFTLGTMVLIGLSFNMLNFLSVLLISGIGIDYGVHILHHYKKGETRVKNLFSSVGRAILLTTLTTMCGFGSLVFSSYRGIASLGQALFIGVGYAFIMTVIVLPIMLKEK